MRRVLIMSGVFLVLAGISGCGEDRAGDPSADQAQAAAPVRVAQAEMRELKPTVPISGTVVSRLDATVSAEVTGRLTSVAEEGTQVDEGATLATIDDTQLRLQVQEQQATVQREQSQVDYLKKEVARLKSLAEQNALAENQLDQRDSELQVAESDLEVAKSRLAQLRDQLRRTTIQAPFAGLVTQRLSVPGERVAPGDGVVRLVSAQQREVLARGPLEYLPYVSMDDPIQVRRGESALVGRVRTVVRTGDEQSHLFEMRISLPDNDWPVGQSVQVGLPTSDTRQVLAVPRDALVLRRDGTAVYVVEGDGTARRVMVNTGQGEGPYVEIRGEVKAGDTVIIRGNERLQPGQPVKVLGADSEPRV